MKKRYSTEVVVIKKKGFGVSLLIHFHYRNKPIHTTQKNIKTAEKTNNNIMICFFFILFIQNVGTKFNFSFENFNRTSIR